MSSQAGQRRRPGRLASRAAVLRTSEPGTLHERLREVALDVSPVAVGNRSARTRQGVITWRVSGECRFFLVETRGEQRSAHNNHKIA